MKKLKNIYLLAFGLVSLFAFNMNVVAENVSRGDGFGVGSHGGSFGGTTNNACETLLGSSASKDYPMFWIMKGLRLIRYIAIIALLVLVTMDFLSALVQNDKDALKKAGTKAFKRFIYCVILFFVPNIVEILFDLFGISGGCIEEVIIRL